MGVNPSLCEFGLVGNSGCRCWPAPALNWGHDPCPPIRSLEAQASRPGDQQLELKALVDLDGIAETSVDPDWRLALSAVIEEVRGRLSYWALTHPTEKPDFHHEAGFLVGPDRNRTNAPVPGGADRKMDQS